MTYTIYAVGMNPLVIQLKKTNGNQCKPLRKLSCFSITIATRQAHNEH